MGKLKLVISTLLVFLIGIILSYLVVFYIPDKKANSEKKGDYKTEIVTEKDLEDILKVDYLEDNSKIISKQVEIRDTSYYDKSLDFYFPSTTSIKILYEVNKDIIDQKAYYKQNGFTITNPEEYSVGEIEGVEDIIGQKNFSILYRNLNFGTKQGLGIELEYEIYIYVIETDDPDTYQILVSCGYPYPIELEE